jgi:hypothetical protein
MLFEKRLMLSADEHRFLDRQILSHEASYTNQNNQVSEFVVVGFQCFFEINIIN